MDERKQLTLLYSFNKNWIGGTYYVLNIIKALNTLQLDELKPYITLFYQANTSITDIQAIQYPYIHYFEANFRLPLLKRVLNITSKLIFSVGLFDIELQIQKINFLYPLATYINTKNVKSACYWIPDFQEHYLPQFFRPFECTLRYLNKLVIIHSGLPIVFSSFNASDDFKRFYPEAKNKTITIPFVSIIGNNYKSINIIDLKRKYNFPLLYFMSPNQFWKHKNHFAVLKALNILKLKDIKTTVVFTGKEYDVRNPNYFSSLKKYIEEKKLGDYVCFLGFIDRDEQLQIMNNALCIIQPSLFEGWSTVVEDAKALGKYSIVSDIPIHREQLQENCSFFDPLNPVDLADKMESFIKTETKVYPINYDRKIKEFANGIVNLIGM